MDGNGRWATRRGLPRSAGHRAGARAVRRVVEGAARLGVDMLTLYAFSCDNWRRPRAEVAVLMRLFERYLKEETARCRRKGIRLRMIGHRHRFASTLVRAIERAEAATSKGQRMTLRLAVDYSSRELLAKAARGVISGHPEELGTALGAVLGADEQAPDVDLLVRTSGERRLSDFLLWECAYAELLFVDTLWPDFGEEELRSALRELSRRKRRFGGIDSEIAQ